MGRHKDLPLPDGIALPETDIQGNPRVASGQYFAKMKYQGNVLCKKLLILK